MCFDLRSHVEDARREGLTEIRLLEAVPEKVSGMFWCKAVDAVGEDGECGRQCQHYDPRNGKSGICKEKSILYTHGKEVVFTFTP